MTLNLRIPLFFWWLPLSGAHQSAAIEAELLAVVAHASKSNWLQTRQPDLRLLDEATIKRFLQRDQNIVHSAESAPLRRFLAMLREIGVAPAKPPEPKSDQRRFFDEYRRYLRQERGLAEATLVNYVPFAEQLIANRFGQSVIRITELTARDSGKQY